MEWILLYSPSGKGQAGCSIGRYRQGICALPQGKCVSEGRRWARQALAWSQSLHAPCSACYTALCQDTGIPTCRTLAQPRCPQSWSTAVLQQHLPCWRRASHLLQLHKEHKKFTKHLQIHCQQSMNSHVFPLVKNMGEVVGWAERAPMARHDAPLSGPRTWPPRTSFLNYLPSVCIVVNLFHEKQKGNKCIVIK